MLYKKRKILLGCLLAMVTASVLVYIGWQYRQPSNNGSQLVAEASPSSDLAVPVNVALTYLGEWTADTSVFYERYELADYVKFVWWYQYTTQAQVEHANTIYQTSLPSIDFDDQYMVISFGRKIEKLTYKKNAHYYTEDLYYEGIPEYGMEYKPNTVYAYAMEQVPFINSEVNTTENNDISALNVGQMPDRGVHESAKEKWRKYY